MIKEMGAFGAHYSDVKIEIIVQAYSKDGSAESHSANVANESHTMRFIDLEYAGFPRRERAIYERVMWDDVEDLLDIMIDDARRDQEE